MIPIKDEAASSGLTGRAANGENFSSAFRSSSLTQNKLSDKPPIERLLKPAQVADILGVGKSCVYRLLGRDLPAVRFGKSVRVRMVDLEAFIASRVEGGES